MRAQFTGPTAEWIRKMSATQALDTANLESLVKDVESSFTAVESNLKTLKSAAPSVENNRKIIEFEKVIRTGKEITKAVKDFKQNVDNLNTAIEELKKITSKKPIDNDAYQKAVIEVDGCNAAIARQLKGPDKHRLTHAFQFPNADNNKSRKQKSDELFALTKQLADIDDTVQKMHKAFDENTQPRKINELTPEKKGGLIEKMANEFGFTHDVWNDEKKKFEKQPVLDSKGNPINLSREEAEIAKDRWNAKYAPKKIELEGKIGGGYVIRCGNKHNKQSMFEIMAEVQNESKAAASKSAASTVTQSQPTAAPATPPTVTQSQPVTPVVTAPSAPAGAPAASTTPPPPTTPRGPGGPGGG